MDLRDKNPLEESSKTVETVESTEAADTQVSASRNVEKKSHRGLMFGIVALLVVVVAGVGIFVSQNHGKDGTAGSTVSSASVAPSSETTNSSSSADPAESDNSKNLNFVVSELKANQLIPDTTGISEKALANVNTDQKIANVDGAAVVYGQDVLTTAPMTAYTTVVSTSSGTMAAVTYDVDSSNSASWRFIVMNSSDPNKVLSTMVYSSAAPTADDINNAAATHPAAN